MPDDFITRRKEQKDRQRLREVYDVTGRDLEGGRDWSDVSTSEGFPQPPETRREAWNRISLIASGRTNPANTLIWDFWLLDL